MPWGETEARIRSDPAPSGSHPDGLRGKLYCLVPSELGPKVERSLRRHFQDDPSVEVIVERRSAERRSGVERRLADSGPPAGVEERRRIKNPDGRRVGERRASLVRVDSPSLPRGLRRCADRLVFARAPGNSAGRREDLDVARIVTRVQAGEKDAFEDLYVRCFEQVYGYLRVLLRDPHEAEDATQQVFVKLLEALPRYERRRPFDAWLFTVVRNVAIDHLRKQGKIEVEEAEQLNRRLELTDHSSEGLNPLEWIRDQDLVVLIERLPLIQRQVLMLRFMMDLPSADVGRILGRSATDVRTLQHRAVRFLETRLRAIGRGPAPGRRPRARVCTRQAPVLRTRRFALR